MCRAFSRDSRLEELVDEIDVRKRCQRVFTRERKIGQVGTATEEHVQGPGLTQPALSRSERRRLVGEPLVDLFEPFG